MGIFAKLFGNKKNNDEEVKEDNTGRISFGTIISAKNYDHLNNIDLKNYNSYAKDYNVEYYVVINDTGVTVDVFLIYFDNIKQECDENYNLKFDNQNYKSLLDRFDENFQINVELLENFGKERVMHIVGELNKNDIKLLHKKMEIADKNGKYKGYNVKINSLPLDVKDIFIDKKNNYYLVMEKNKDGFYCLPLIEGNNENAIDINGTKFLPMFKSVKKFSKLDDYKRYDIVSDLTFESLKEEYKKNHEIKDNKNGIGRGSLVLMNQQKVYLYNENNENLEGYFVNDEKLRNDFGEVVVNKKVYYSDFQEQLKVNIKEDVNDIKLLDKATEKEMIINTENKKKHKKLNKRKNKDYEKIIDVGSVVVEKGSNIELLVLHIDKDKLVGVLYNKAVKGIYEFITVNINDCKCLRQASIELLYATLLEMQLMGIDQSIEEEKEKNSIKK